MREAVSLPECADDVEAGDVEADTEDVLCWYSYCNWKSHGLICFVVLNVSDIFFIIFYGHTIIYIMS